VKRFYCICVLPMSIFKSQTNYMKVTVDIICPKCSGKAQFHSELIGSYKLYPNSNGKLTCTHCGFNANHIFSNRDYSYQIEVRGRKLFARDRDNLIKLRDFFEHGYNHKEKGDPELDFPKEFYLNKEEIVKQINNFLEREGY
jgi:hypothetical protein